MKISDKRKAGEILERGGISQRIIQIANEISQGTYQEAIENAGRIAVLVEAATYDEYWTAKASTGKHKEHGVLLGIIEGGIKLDSAICETNLGK